MCTWILLKNLCDLINKYAGEIALLQKKGSAVIKSTKNCLNKIHIQSTTTDKNSTESTLYISRGNDSLANEKTNRQCRACQKLCVQWERAERKHTLVLKPAASQDELDAHKGNQQSTISCETSAPHSCVFTTFVLEKQNVGSETKSKWILWG